MAATQSQSGAPRAIERVFQVSLYLLIVTGFVTLTSTGKLDIPTVLCVGAALVYRGYLVFRAQEVRIPSAISSYLGLFYAAFYLVDLFALSQNFVTATVHLVLFAMTIKVFSIERERDYVYLAILAFLEVLSAAILTIDTVFFAAFTVFALIAIVTFISMEMRRSAAMVDRSQMEMPPELNSRRFAWAVSKTGLVIVAGVMVFASLIFFALPRLSYGYLSRFAQQDAMTTGFSDTVSIGEIGRIQQSSQVVMHLMVEGDTIGTYQLKLRGAALSRFDGHRWTTAYPRTQNIRTLTGRIGITTRPSISKLDIARVAQSAHHNVISYRVLMEPLATSYVFLVNTPRDVFGNFRELTVGLDNTVQYFNRDRMLSGYQGTSDIAQPLPAELIDLNTGVPSELANPYLQVPELDKRIGRLAHELTDKYPTPYAKAAAIERYLSTEFGYTLQLPSEMPDDPLADFLFSRRRGHCEYFASAMAIMLRQVGIPSRVITGFRGGEFNLLTNSYIVRGRDAHAWVEGYIAGAGWTTFDPTPAGDALVVTPWRRAQLYMDAARQFWREWVVNYDVGQQQKLTDQTVRTTRTRVEGLREWFRHKYSNLLAVARKAQSSVSQHPVRFGSYAGLAIAAVILLLSSPRLIRAVRDRRVGRNPKRAPQTAATLWYQRVNRTVAKRGFKREPSQTPSEFAAGIADVRLRHAVKDFTQAYERARFEQDPEAAGELPELYKQVELTSRESR